MLEKEIHELLYHHDCVIVPDLGGFLTHYRPARIDEAQRSVHPPSKDVSFNRNLVRSDGLLTDHVARRRAIGFDEAGRRITRQVDEWRKDLERKGRLELARIGTLYHDGSRELQFEPDRRMNYLRDAYGLRPVAATPLLRNTLQRTPSPARGLDQGPLKADTSSTSRTWVRAAAAGALLLALGATYWVMSGPGRARSVWSGMDLFGPMEQEDYRPRAEEVIALAEERPAEWMPNEQVHGVRELPVIGREGALSPVDLGPEVATPESTAVAVSVVRDKYHVIGGCFSMKENADRFILHLIAQGFPAHLVDEHGGLFRVAYGSYPQRTAALEALQAVRREHAPEAWLLVR